MGRGTRGIWRYKFRMFASAPNIFSPCVETCLSVDENGTIEEETIERDAAFRRYDFRKISKYTKFDLLGLFASHVHRLSFTAISFLLQAHLDPFLAPSLHSHCILHLLLDSVVRNIAHLVKLPHRFCRWISTGEYICVEFSNLAVEIVDNSRW